MTHPSGATAHKVSNKKAKLMGFGEYDNDSWELYEVRRPAAKEEKKQVTYSSSNKYPKKKLEGAH